jgi:hypothetical protein
MDYKETAASYGEKNKKTSGAAQPDRLANAMIPL